MQRAEVWSNGMQSIFEQLQINPVIAAVGSEDALEEAVRSECRVIFLLMGNILDIGALTSRVRSAGKLCVIHLDLIEGFSGKEIAVDAVKKLTVADGIISTRGTQIRRAKQLGMTAIQRGFMLDSRSLGSFETQIGQSKPDYVEILPGLLPKVIAELKQRVNVPIIAGGFIHEKEDVIAAIQAGALAVSASSPQIWSM
jgi:glycerol-3-phosphate responsive antiterminator